MRLRREYLYRKAQEDRLRTIEEKKQKLKGALDGRTACSFISIFLRFLWQMISGVNCFTTNPVSLQKIIFFQLRYAKKLCSYRNYWSMMTEGRKASLISFCLKKNHQPILFNHQCIHLCWVGIFPVQVSAHTWMMSINGLELKTLKSWSPHPETPVPDSKCLPRSVSLQ